MKNGKQKTYHIKDENGHVLAKFLVTKEYDAYVGAIFVDSHTPSAAAEPFDDESNIHQVIRDLIFKVSLTGFKEIEEVDAAAASVRTEAAEKGDGEEKRKKKKKDKGEKKKGKKKKGKK